MKIRKWLARWRRRCEREDVKKGNPFHQIFSDDKPKAPEDPVNPEENEEDEEDD